METTAQVLVLDPAISDVDLEEVLSIAGHVVAGGNLTRGDAWAALPLGEGVPPADVDVLKRLPSVRRVVDLSAPYRLASRELFGEAMAIDVSCTVAAETEALVTAFGGRAPIGVIASSRWASSSDSRFSVLAPLLSEAGCSVFHAGQLKGSADGAGTAGLTLESLQRLRDVAHDFGIAIGVEVEDPSRIAPAAEIADLLQVGSRNMQDFRLLRELGGIDRPILLRRGAGATVEEFLLAAEYVLVHGNGRVILCESGIRSFDALQKPRFEINAIPLIKQLSHLPIVADPSQTAPHASAVPAMSKAAVAAGADGVVVEVGPEAVFDSNGVAIDIEALQRLTAELRPIARAVGRTFGARRVDASVPPATPRDVLGLTDRTLAQTIELVAGIPPHLDVADQWRIPAPASRLSPPLSTTGDVLVRCTGYRMGSVRLSCNVSYVDLSRIDPTIGALLEATHLNLGQLFVDARIEKLAFEFGTDEEAGEFDEVFRKCFPDEVDELHPYVWRRYQAAIEGVVTFIVIEALPVAVWKRLLDPDPAVQPHDRIDP